MNNLFRSLRKKVPSASNERSKTPDEKKRKDGQARKTKDLQEQHLLSCSAAEAPQSRRGPLHLFHRNDNRKTREAAPNKNATARTPGSISRRQNTQRNAKPAIIAPSPAQKQSATSEAEAARRPASASVSTHHPFVAEESDPLVQLALTQKTSSIGDEARLKISLAVKALDRAGNTLFEKGDYDAAFLRYERSLWLKQKTVEAEAPSTKKSEQDKSVMAAVATSINNMTYLKQRSGKASTAETMSSYLKSLQIKREILGPDHLSVGKTLNNIGSVFYMSREFDAALTAYKDAFRILKQHLGEDHLDAVTVVCNIADVQVAMGDKDGALKNYRKALALRWNELGSQDTKVVRLMEQVARLETGDQPRLRVDDETELGFASQEEMREEAIFMDDLKELQQDLAEDMKYFDLVERQMAIDMLRDRTQMIREMRALEQQQQEEATVASKSEKFCASELVSCRKPISVEETEDVESIGGLSAFELPTLDQFLNEDKLGHGVEMIQQDVRSHGAVSTNDSPASEVEGSNILQKELYDENEFGIDRASLGIETSFGRQVTENGQSSLYAVVKRETSSATEELGTTISITSDSDYTNGSDEGHAQTHVIDVQESDKASSFSTNDDEEPRRFSVKPRLTPSERRTALISVQSRLEELRAKRGLVPASKVTIPSDHRTYMDQTASSVAKSNPCRKHSVQGQTIRANAEAAAAN